MRRDSSTYAGFGEISKGTPDGDEEVRWAWAVKLTEKLLAADCDAAKKSRRDAGATQTAGEIQVPTLLQNGAREQGIPRAIHAPALGCEAAALRQNT